MKQLLASCVLVAILATGFAAIVIAVVAAPATETEPLLTIEGINQYSGHHPVSAIGTITFVQDTLLVSEVGGRATTYALDTVRHIWFDLSGSATAAPMNPDATSATMKALYLFQNRPNPASLSTSIQFDLPTSGHVSVAIYAVSGAHVCSLLDGDIEPGRHTVTWDGTNGAGRRVAGGVYFCRLVANGIDESRRMVYLR